MNLESKKNFLINFCFWICIITLVYLGFKFLLPFLVPFLLGFGISYILRPLIVNLSRTFYVKYQISAIIFVSLFYVFIGLLIAFVGLGLVYGIQSFLLELPTLYSNYAEEVILSISNYIENLVITIGHDAELAGMIEEVSGYLINSITDLFSTISSWLVNSISSFATSIPGFFIKAVLMIISTYFIAMDYNKIMQFFSKQVGSKVSNFVVEVKDYLFGTVFVCIKSYAIIMTITFIELSIGLTLIGIDNSIIIALLISIFDILPVLGTGGIMIPWSIINFIMGNIKLGVLLAIVYIVVTIIRNIIEPKIVGKELGLHPLVTLVSMFIGVNIAGIIGLFGFPILLSLIVHLNNKGTIKIIKE